MLDQMRLFAMLATVAVIAGGLVFVLGLRRTAPSLADCLALLGESELEAVSAAGPALVIENSRLERFGAWCYTAGRIPVPEHRLQSLARDGRSVGDYILNKLILAVIGLVAPGILALALRPLLGVGVLIPVGFGIVAGIIGWLWPDIAMRADRARADRDAQEAVNTYFDLVLLERLANQSATGALESAASLSDVPVFRQIRAALQQARLEQRPPWRNLHRCADDLGLPAIGDLADVMRLEDQGASLAEVLAARVAELRDAHLSAEKTAATQVSERMTVWMTIPVIIFALAMLIPPMLTMSAG